MGRVMAALKERHGGAIEPAKAGTIAKKRLS